MTSETFKCRNCGGVFEKTRTDEEAWAEFVRDFPGEAAKVASGQDEKTEICEDCYQSFIRWLGQQCRGMEL